MNFQNEKIIEMFHDEKILTYLSKKLITFYKLFQSLSLPINIVRNLIKNSKTFDENCYFTLELIYCYFIKNPYNIN